MTKLSDNFSLSEFTKSVAHPNIPNTPSASQIANLKAVCENILEPARAHFSKLKGRDMKVSINSGFRGEPLEKAICWGGDNDKSPFATWCKNPKRNKPVNEASWAEYFKRKSHPEGEAVDFEIPGIDNSEIAIFVRDNLKFDQCILEFHHRGDGSSGWVHVSYKAAGCRAECLTANAKGTFPGFVI